MTTVQLHDYLIVCDRQYSEAECRRDLVIRDVISQNNAEARAKAAGWKIGLRTGCPPCEQWWESQQGAAT